MRRGNVPVEFIQDEIDQWLLMCCAKSIYTARMVTFSLSDMAISWSVQILMKKQSRCQEGNFPR